MEKEKKFAVLIDADNISDKYIKIILDETANSGIATYKRIYGDWTSPALSSWKNVLLDNSIIPIQQYSYTFGKNSTDCVMIIDAMDILYSETVDGFCLVSSDSDFTRLAARLRESGMYVIGMGESKTPKPFISACNQFKYLDILLSNSTQKLVVSEKEDKETQEEIQEQKRIQEEKEILEEKGILEGKEILEESGIQEKEIQEERNTLEEKTKNERAISRGIKKEKLEPRTNLKMIKQAIYTIIEEAADDLGWMFSAELKNIIDKRYPDFDVRNFGYSKFTPFVESLGNIEVKRIKSNAYSNAELVYFRLK